MRDRHGSRLPHRLGAALAALLGLSAPAGADSLPLQVLHRYYGGPDGGLPSGLIAGAAGNLYGTTVYGGDPSACSSDGITQGCGVVFQLSPLAGGGWSETILYKFQGGDDGAQPGGSLVLGPDGTIFGTTLYGGDGACTVLAHNGGCGVVFALAPPNPPSSAVWSEQVLHSFSGGADGGTPESLIADYSGGFTLVGTVLSGGGSNLGAVFRLAPGGAPWNETLLHSFTGIPRNSNVGDGAAPIGVLFDQHGQLFGVTAGGGRFVGNGGQGGSVNGTVFQLSPPAGGAGPWGETVVHRFTPAEQAPTGDLTIDAAGAIFGSTAHEAFELTTDGIQRVFTFPTGGSPPYYVPGVSADATGNLYGTATGGRAGQGRVFRLNQPANPGQPWTETLLHSFNRSPHGNKPEGILAITGGALYGATVFGQAVGRCRIDDGYGCSTLYRLTLP